MRKILFIVCMLCSMTAHAGFVTGVVVGSSMSGGTTTKYTDSTVISKMHSVISCKKVSADAGEYCEVSRKTNGAVLLWNNNFGITPHQYAGNSGYSIIHGVGLQFSNGYTYILMEVSK